MLARLADVFADAATFPERINSNYFEPDPAAGSRELDLRVARWLRTAGEIGDAQALRAGLRTVRVRNLDALPSWAVHAKAFLSAVAFDDTEDCSATTALEAFERAARTLLPCVDFQIAGSPVDAAGYAGIIDALRSRLIEVCNSVMRFELQIADPAADSANWLEAPGVACDRLGWLNRFERFPALAYVVGVACEQWRRSVLEILQRLRRDFAMLRAKPFCLDESDPITEFKTGAGDRHAGGRSVTLLRFASGRGIVYKPKDLRHVEATMRVIAFLNGAGLSLPLATRVTLCRDGYGWEERVEPEPAADCSAFARFYRRLGMLMRLMQALNGRDLWADNLIAAGEQPFLTDLECMLTPALRLPRRLAADAGGLVARLETTVVRTSMPLHAMIPSGTMTARDMGCLSHAGDPKPSGGGLPLAPYRPWVAGDVAEPWDHGSDVCAGYREMHELLVANCDALGGVLSAFEDVPMRYIWRGTPEYLNLVWTSVTPTALVDGTARETLLSVVSRCADPATGREIDFFAVASAEIDALRELDVPLFTYVTTSRSLFTPKGVEIPGYFAGTGMQEVRRRLAALNEIPVETELAILRGAIDAARGGKEVAFDSESPPSIRRPRAARRTALCDDELLQAADEIAALLLSARQAPLGTGRDWIAVTWWPVPDVWDVGYAPADFIGGTLGPAMFLGQFSALSGHREAGTASRDALRELRATFTSNAQGAVDDPRLALGAPVPGGYGGPGAVLYATAHLAALLHDDSLLPPVELLEYAAARAEEPGVAVDLPFGLAGLQLELLGIRAALAPVDFDLDSLIARLGARLCQTFVDRESGPLEAVNPRLADLVPTGLDGVALAIARTLAVAPELMADRATAIDALSVHSFDVDVRGARMAANGSYGCGALESAPRSAKLGPIDVKTAGTRAQILRAEEAQFAARCTGSEEAAVESRRCLRRILDRRAATGQWFPDRIADDRLLLSALDGMSALGSALLRQIRPEIPVISVLQ